MSLKQMVWKFIADEQAADLVEYSLLLVLIALAAMTALTALGTTITGIFTKTSERITSASNTVT